MQFIIKGEGVPAQKYQAMKTLLLLIPEDKLWPYHHSGKKAMLLSNST
jgi:hypothetical protein